MKLKFMLDEGAFAPVKGHKIDAGYDIKTPYGFDLMPGKDISINTRVHICIPEGYVGFLKSKSGLNVIYGITTDGTIDSGYTGEIVAKLRMDAQQGNIKHFAKGDKIAQIVIVPIIEAEMEQVDKEEFMKQGPFAKSSRGNSGFGSTGR